MKFNSSNVCYTGPITKSNLALITCPNSRQLITTEVLHQCYHDSSAFICPLNVLTTATDVTWLGFPFNPDTKLTFPRNHVQATDCSNLHPLVHLGGHEFLATSTVVLPLSSGPLVTSPLAVYSLPCNESFHGIVTGIGTCPQSMTVLVPLVTPSTMQFIPWAGVTYNASSTSFSYPSFDIPSPARLNKSVIDNLDATFTSLDGQLTTSLNEVDHEINHLHSTSITPTTDFVAYSALALALFSSVGVLIILLVSRRHVKRNSRRTCQCGRLIAGAREVVDNDTSTPAERESDSVHEDTRSHSNSE